MLPVKLSHIPKFYNYKITLLNWESLKRLSLKISLLVYTCFCKWHYTNIIVFYSLSIYSLLFRNFFNTVKTNYLTVNQCFRVQIFINHCTLFVMFIHSFVQYFYMVLTLYINLYLSKIETHTLM